MQPEIFDAVLDLCDEPFALIASSEGGWPVLYANKAFRLAQRPIVAGDHFEVSLDRMLERGSALAVADAMRSMRPAKCVVRVSGHSHLMDIQPLEEHPGHVAVWLRSAGAGTGRQNLANARVRRSVNVREDPVTGLLTEAVFMDALRHDWAVARREGTRLGIVLFRIVDFDLYVATFGRSGADTCLKRVGQALRGCLRRASDVIARSGDDAFFVLSHAAADHAVQEYADQISAGVRELGLHHPKSSTCRFVTLSTAARVVTPADEAEEPDAVIQALTANP